MIKSFWVKAIIENGKLPVAQRRSPSFLLNELFENMTGQSCTTTNMYSLRDGSNTIPQKIRFRPSDGIYRCTMEWAGLDSQYPKLVNCLKFEGKANPDILYVNGHSPEIIAQAISDSL